MPANRVVCLRMELYAVDRPHSSARFGSPKNYLMFAGSGESGWEGGGSGCQSHFRLDYSHRPNTDRSPNRR